MDQKLIQIVTRLAEILDEGHLSLSTAESCTGGWVAHVLTTVPTSSTWFERGFVTYSDQSKIDLLQVNNEIIQTKGAVSKEVAIAMASGAIKNSLAQISLSITGSAGPDPDPHGTPVGICYFGWKIKGQIYSSKKIFDGDRININYQAVTFSLSHLIYLLKNYND